jgi:hypothetical protein
VAPDTSDALDWLRKHLEGDDNDLIREMVRAFAERFVDGRGGRRVVRRRLE